MPISLTCECGRALKVKEEYAGKQARCPSCQKVVSIPMPAKKVEDEALDFLLADSGEETPRSAAVQRERPVPARRDEDAPPRRPIPPREEPRRPEKRRPARKRDEED